MNEKLFRPQFDTLKLSDKLWLMQTLAARYHFPLGTKLHHRPV